MQLRLLPVPCPSVACRTRVHGHISHIICLPSNLVIEVMTVRQPTNTGMLDDKHAS